MDRPTLELRQAELRIRHTEANLTALIAAASTPGIRKARGLKALAEFWEQVRADADLVEKSRDKRRRGPKKETPVLGQVPMEFRCSPDSPVAQPGA